MRFCAGETATRQIIRTDHEFKDWAHSGGPAQRTRSFLKDLGWRETEEWVWKRETSGKFLVLQKTNSRFVGSLTAWILWHTAWESLGDVACGSSMYVGSGRHETVALANEAYSDRLAKSARTQGKDRDATSVGTWCGATVCPAAANQIPALLGENCSWCDHPGFFQHVSWECPRYPILPSKVTQQLGWGCYITLKHLAEVRRRLLVDRYDADWGETFLGERPRQTALFGKNNEGAGHSGNVRRS